MRYLVVMLSACWMRAPSPDASRRPLPWGEALIADTFQVHRYGPMLRVAAGYLYRAFCGPGCARHKLNLHCARTFRAAAELSDAGLDWTRPCRHPPCPVQGHDARLA